MMYCAGTVPSCAHKNTRHRGSRPDLASLPCHVCLKLLDFLVFGLVLLCQALHDRPQLQTRHVSACLPRRFMATHPCQICLECREDLLDAPLDQHSANHPKAFSVWRCFLCLPQRLNYSAARSFAQRCAQHPLALCTYRCSSASLSSSPIFVAIPCISLRRPWNF